MFAFDARASTGNAGSANLDHFLGLVHPQEVITLDQTEKESRNRSFATAHSEDTGTSAY